MEILDELLDKIEVVLDKGNIAKVYRIDKKTKEKHIITISK